MRRAAAGLLALLSAASPALAGFDGRLWDDGRAEVAVYDAQRVVDDKPRDFRETLTLAKEDLRVDSLLKTEKSRDVKTVRAFKMNQIDHFDAQNYAYSYLTSVFTRADDPSSVLKLTVGSQEALGNLFKMFTRPPGGTGMLATHSYVDGEGDRTEALDVQPGDLFDDALPLSLRALPLKTGFQLKARLWENMTNNHGLPPAVAPVTIRVLDEDTVHCHAGGIVCWKVSVERAAGAADTYWFEKAEPHILVRMETADGRKRTLYGRARWSYWDHRIPRPNILN